MYLNRIGTKYADFFIAWAKALEASGSYPQASIVFTKGLSMNAEPKDMLEREKRHFEDRLALRTIEDMMRGEEQPAQERQALQKQGVAVSTEPPISDEDSTIKSKSSRTVSGSQRTTLNAVQSFSVHQSDSTSKPGKVGAAFTAVRAPSASNVMPTKHNPDKENSQQPAKWTKPSSSRTSAPVINQKSVDSKLKPGSTSFQIYCDDEETDDSARKPVLMNQSALKLRREDSEDVDTLLASKPKVTDAKKKDSNENVKFMFSDSIMNGPLGEMSFEELRANHIFLLEKQGNAFAGVSHDENHGESVDSTKMFFDDGEHLANCEMEMTMALSNEVSRREIKGKPGQSTDARMLGVAAFSDSILPSANDTVRDDWGTKKVNETVESLRESHDSDHDISSEFQPSGNSQTQKLSMTQLDCLNRIFSEAYQHPQASSATPFGMTNDESVVSKHDGSFMPYSDSIMERSTNSGNIKVCIFFLLII